MRINRWFYTSPPRLRSLFRRRQVEPFSDMVFWTGYSLNLSGSGSGEPESARVLDAPYSAGARNFN
jgi:hypothetical protein